VQMQSQYSLLR